MASLSVAPTDLPPTIFSDPSANEGVSLFFALWCSHVNREFLLYELLNV
jgi:hypothetical protein